jgi:serine/threonine protein kinase
MAQTIARPLRRWDPDRIGPYAIVGKLGAGAMGQVFLAKSPAGRLVAVKTIRPELAEEPGFRTRFAREVAAASRVSGVFTAAVIEADAEADLPWVATAYVPAPSLDKLVRTCGPLPVPAVRWLAAGCAEALASIHATGLLHRDVKPSNVLVAPDGPRVIDFGVARAAERVQLTSTRGAAGTPAYMAPEQARDATQASPASDVFSLGATLVFAATGHAPYRGETVMDILVRLATEPPDLDGVPPELSELVTACLERKPRNRPSDAAILSALGPFDLGTGPGHLYLPGSAMTLIGEYQNNNPLRPDWAGFEGESAGSETNWSGVPAFDDATSGSHTALPGFHSVTGFRAPPSQSHSAATSPGAAASPSRAAPRRSRRAGTGGRRAELVFLPGWARAVAGVALIAVGLGLGWVLRGSAAGSAGSVAATQCPSALPNTTPELCLAQPFGDRETVFIIHGSGYAPFTQVKIALSAPGITLRPGEPADQPETDKQGTFNYAINQGHYFYPGPLPSGAYTVQVTATGEREVTTSFIVNTVDTGLPAVNDPASGFPGGNPPPSGFPGGNPPPSGFPGGNPPPTGPPPPAGA